MHHGAQGGALTPHIGMRPPPAVIISVLPSNEWNTMDAEHINSIANKLDDIAQRAAELRRYL